MSLISLASGKSLWRGYEYYEDKHVHFHIQNGEFEYTGKVSGNGRSYDVHIDLKHPRKSTCNCPHADGKRIICKHTRQKRKEHSVTIWQLLGLQLSFL